MKARTKAAKRRGRPRKIGVVRTPSGQPSRAKEHDMAYKLMMEAATWKRRRDNPSLSVEDARRQEHGSVIHMWKLASDKARKKNPDAANDHLFTETHLDTAERIHELYQGYRAAIASRNPRSASDFTGPGGFDGTDPFERERERRDERAVARWKEARAAILASGPLGMMAVETIIFENKPVDRLLGDLRLALNEVYRVWQRQKAA